MKYHVAVISHARPENIIPIQKIVGEAWFYVNKGEGKLYKEAGAKHVVEAGTNICHARNRALVDSLNLPCIQVSDDLKGIKSIRILNGKRIQTPVTFKEVVDTLIEKLRKSNLYFGGVAVTNNALNYTGIDFSYDKLVVNDLICIMPAKKPIQFDVNMALKEDYDLCIRQLIEVGGVLRCEKYLCNFPHRDNKGGANLYRNTATEAAVTKKLFAKWGPFILPHKTRPGQVSLNYKLIRQAREQAINQTK